MRVLSLYSIKDVYSHFQVMSIIPITFSLHNIPILSIQKERQTLFFKIFNSQSESTLHCISLK